MWEYNLYLSITYFTYKCNQLSSWDVGPPGYNCIVKKPPYIEKNTILLNSIKLENDTCTFSLDVDICNNQTYMIKDNRIVVSFENLLNYIEKKKN